MILGILLYNLTKLSTRVFAQAHGLCGLHKHKACYQTNLLLKAGYDKQFTCFFIKKTRMADSLHRFFG